jgi:hypothetical protein
MADKLQIAFVMDRLQSKYKWDDEFKAHWRDKDVPLHIEIHHIANECMEALGEWPIEGRAQHICEAIYRGAALILETNEPWLKR